MGLSLLAWTNRVKTAGLVTVGTAPVSGLTETQLQNDQGSPAAAWQVPGTTASLTIDSGSDASTWRVFGLFRTNLTGSATVRWRVGSYDSGTISAGVAPGYGQSVVLLAGDVTGRTVQLDVADPANPDGFINVPLAFAGSTWQPVIGASWTSTFGRDVKVDEVETRGGQEYPTLRFMRRRWAIELNAVRAAEVYSQLDVLDRVCRAGGNVFFCPDWTAPNPGQMAIYGRCQPTQDVTFAYQGGDARSWKANITERL